MYEELFTSTIRSKMLEKFYILNETGCLRSIATEFEISSNSVRVELKKLYNLGLIIPIQYKNKKIYKANEQHPLYNDLASFLKKCRSISKNKPIIIKRKNRGTKKIKDT
jgi:Mn-dependent DtxR family transcriptional regulator